MDEIHRKEPAKYAIFLQGKLQMYLNTKLAGTKVQSNKFVKRSPLQFLILIKSRYMGSVTDRPQR